MNYLVESCLITHGIPSLSNEDIIKIWDIDSNFVWIEDGEIKVGNINDLMVFRNKNIPNRINKYTLDKALREKKSGALTASGTMEVCDRLNVSFAISCGLAGFMEDDTKPCPDLKTIVENNTTLIAMSFKDMIDAKQSITWLKNMGIEILSANDMDITGYVFNSWKIKADIYNCVEKKNNNVVIFNQIPVEKRIKDVSILNKALEYAKDCVSKGISFHPAVNSKLDELTNGYSSIIQLEGMLSNANLIQSR